MSDRIFNEPVISGARHPTKREGAENVSVTMKPDTLFCAYKVVPVALENWARNLQIWLWLSANLVTIYLDRLESKHALSVNWGHAQQGSLLQSETIFSSELDDWSEE